MTRFCLIRHGQTDWNLEGRYQGQSDIPLNNTGISQAKYIATQLTGYPFAAIYSSDLSRAKKTAEIIATVIKKPVIIDKRLREINLGEWEGQLVEDIKNRYDDLWELRRTDPDSLRAPGGETVIEVASRMYTALDDISSNHATDNIIITSHGLSLATVICKMKSIPVGRAYHHSPDNAVPIWIDWDHIKDNPVL